MIFYIYMLFDNFCLFSVDLYRRFLFLVTSVLLFRIQNFFLIKHFVFQISDHPIQNLCKLYTRLLCHRRICTLRTHAVWPMFINRVVVDDTLFPLIETAAVELSFCLVRQGAFNINCFYYFLISSVCTVTLGSRKISAIYCQFNFQLFNRSSWQIVRVHYTVALYLYFMTLRLIFELLVFHVKKLISCKK